MFNKMATKVITSERIKNYLYSLGLNYTVKKDLKDENKNIYIFKVDDDFLEAMYFYDAFRTKLGLS